MKEYGELKKRAILARQRLKMGYWDRLERERIEFLKREGDSLENQRRIKEIQRARFYRENAELNGDSVLTEREKMYVRVCEILEQNEDVTNPIGQLVDYEKYNSLDESGKQRYVLWLSKEYNELKQRYYQERAIKYC
jgi:hypothetical protein